MSLALLAMAWMALGSWALCARLWPSPAPLGERAHAAVLFAPACTCILVFGLGTLHEITPAGIGLALLLAGAGLLAVAGNAARAQTRVDLAHIGRLFVALRRDPIAAGAVLVGLLALGSAVVAAWLLPVWSWDGLGYHLPLVHEAFARRDLSPGPVEAPYLHTYPRLIEVGFVAWAACLPDDTFVDAAQLPWGLALWVLTATMARRAGASGTAALGMGALCLAVPVVHLQLASNYIDVAVAALGMAAALDVMGAFAARDLVRGALALGMLLGSKPSMPPAVALLGTAWLVRGWRAGRVRWVCAALMGAAVLGGERYLCTALAHGGNPLWPIRMGVGPWRLPGRFEPIYFTNLGVPDWFRPLSWPVRLVASWWSVRVRYVYDQRIGGFGPLFAWALTPTLLWALVRPYARGVLVGALPVLAFVATPAAFWSRYVLAVPCALLAVCIGATGMAGPALRVCLRSAMVATAFVGVMLAHTGFTDGEMSLGAVLAAPPAARETVVSVDNQPVAWREAAASIGPGEAAAYDESFGLPGLLWAPHRAGRVLRVPEGLDATALLVWLEANRVRLLVIGKLNHAAVHLAPQRFVHRYSCRVDACEVYTVRPNRAVTSR